MPEMTAESGRLMKTATYASVLVAGVLIAAKFAAWVMTGSVSMLSTLIDSLLDAAASVLNMIAVHHALVPADKEHRFGHGKAEALSALAQAAFISGSAIFLLAEAAERLIKPKAIENTEIGYGVMALAIVLTLCLVAYQRYVVEKTGSVAIAADSAHYKMDVLVNISVVVSLALSSGFGLGWADPVFALGIAAYILWGAWGIGIQAYHMLMDRELPDSERKTIENIALEHPEVEGVHDLRTRSSGTRVFIQMHLEMDGGMTLDAAHDISDAVEAKIQNAYPRAEVLIHGDPAGLAEDQDVFQ
ncbi:MAG: cation diffusion facilitator family transporter [Rhodospirillales bacterium]|nr:cation diffusion facilitator family transporter [Alphaproteobacteria bacterium]MBL6947411.1 cation diffusion facilitator family transporter [Rhodospirillales bacterium]